GLGKARRAGYGWVRFIAGTLGVILCSGGGVVIDLMTTSEEVRETARVYLVMAALTPLTGMPAWVYDGVMIGATLNVVMRNGMLVSLAAYLACAFALQPVLGLWGLWIALHVLMLARAAIYAFAIERIKPSLFTPA